MLEFNFKISISIYEFSQHFLQRLRAGADADFTNRVLSAKIIIIREQNIILLQIRRLR